MFVFGFFCFLLCYCFKREYKKVKWKNPNLQMKGLKNEFGFTHTKESKFYKNRNNLFGSTKLTLFYNNGSWTEPHSDWTLKLIARRMQTDAKPLSRRVARRRRAVSRRDQTNCLKMHIIRIKLSWAGV